MEPLIKLNNKNNLFDCPIHKTTAELLNGNQPQQKIKSSSNNQQYSVYYLSSYRSHQLPKLGAKKQQARDKKHSDGGHQQQQIRRSQLLIL
jgi:hypothetical protein